MSNQVYKDSKNTYLDATIDSLENRTDLNTLAVADHEIRITDLESRVAVIENLFQDIVFTQKFTCGDNSNESKNMDLRMQNVDKGLAFHLEGDQKVNLSLPTDTAFISNSKIPAQYRPVGETFIPLRITNTSDIISYMLIKKNGDILIYAEPTGTVDFSAGNNRGWYSICGGWFV